MFAHWLCRLCPGQDGAVVRTLTLENMEPLPCHLPAVRLCMSHQTSLCLSFLTCKTGVLNVLIFVKC